MSPYRLRLRRKPSFSTSVCILRARLRTQNTHTCSTPCGRRRRPPCMGILPLQDTAGESFSPLRGSFFPFEWGRIEQPRLLNPSPLKEPGEGPQALRSQGEGLASSILTG
jgi:hypothetical protein